MLNVGYTVAEDIDVEISAGGMNNTNILYDGQHPFKHYIGSMKTNSKSLRLQWQYEDNDDVREIESAVRAICIFRRSMRYVSSATREN